ncbi:hypothetical protein GCM10022207_86640 [Streptomyces lannensis]|uniref:Uncharacterized protein n=1 Tax=Streptomyces lannensis TaxID=766498 RepID=A0ABP7LQA6_9ACTN
MSVGTASPWHQRAPDGQPRRSNRGSRACPRSHVTTHLVTFYDSVGDVTWTELDNGYVRDPAVTSKVSPRAPFCWLL